MSRYIDADSIQYDEDIPGVFIASKTQINNIPAANVRENVRGHWITCTEDNTRLSCSVCGADFYGTVGFIFCPNCGAQMGENDE